jgi:hypothetical protein
MIGVKDDDGALERYETLLASVFVQQKIGAEMLCC